MAACIASFNYLCADDIDDGHVDVADGDDDNVMCAALRGRRRRRGRALMMR